MEHGRAETEPSIDRLRERLLIAPRDAAAMRDLARLLEQAGDLPGAVDLHQRVLRVEPYRLEALLDLGRLWRILADPERSKSWYRRALVVDPDCLEAAEGLDDAGQDQGLSEAYVRTLFDQYADRFDDELTNVLDYRAPSLVAALLQGAGIADGAAAILDLGCGTGLSGSALQRFARRLDGVDLSPRMIEKARARNLYQALTVHDAQAFLMAAAQDWDIIAAIDMLNYLSGLGPIFEAARARLRPAGLLAGTVEKCEAGGSVMTSNRRYTHGLETLLSALDAAKFHPLDITEADLRREGGAAVVGLVFVARRRS